MTNMKLLQRLVEESQVSDRQCAELLVLLKQTRDYLLWRSQVKDDLYAVSLVDQMNKECENVA